MNPSLDRRYPSVADLERQALRRLPKFMGDYLHCGMGLGGALRRNRQDLDAIELLPRYCCDVRSVSTATELLGRAYAAPFGVAPVGLGGLAWPRAQETLAAAARKHEIVFVSSTFSFASLETIRARAGDYAWFQLYRPNEAHVEADLLRRAADAGYETLVVTVDVPGPMRRDHDIRNGFSLPPRWSLRTAFDLATHPGWSLAVGLETLRNGFPGFENFVPYTPSGLSGDEVLAYQSRLIRGHIDPAVFENLRSVWRGRLIPKGVLDPEDAGRYRDLGADAIVVSNHGGRQLEAAPSAVRMLPAIREAVGVDFPLIADGGVRTGLDICRLIASGADFVLLGRAFYYALAALGTIGAEHVTELLEQELRCTMEQLGCQNIAELRARLVTRSCTERPCPDDR